MKTLLTGILIIILAKICSAGEIITTGSINVDQTNIIIHYQIEKLIKTGIVNINIFIPTKNIEELLKQKN